MTLTLLLDDKIDFKVERCSSVKINCLSGPLSLPSQKATHDSSSKVMFTFNFQNGFGMCDKIDSS